MRYFASKGLAARFLEEVCGSFFQNFLYYKPKSLCLKRIGMKRVMQYELVLGRELEIIVGFLLSVSYIVLIAYYTFDF